MRRPPGLWILLSAGVVWLSLQNAYGLRATSLIFGKTTTTTTTTTEKPVSEEQAAEAETVTTTELSNDPNSTKPTLTGNPQIDYIWDPNLPQELNGYNLSDYPFYERVPEDIDFKCDGLHDGFYASVPHKCQVYHHCLYGTRYDFLCANYTAFDQKTFICHFASEVDCVNSKKYWHRNDALYKAETTTTIKPFVIYTTAPPLVTPMISAPSGPGLRRPVGGRRRPFRRRRPQFEYYDDDYYDDYYEDRIRANRGRKRPRPRPRPVYDDDYEEDYAEDRYQRRGGGTVKDEERTERRPYDRRSSNRRRNKDRVKDEYEDEEMDEDINIGNRRKPNTRKRPDDSEEERYSTNRKRPDDLEEERFSSKRKRPDESEEETYSGSRKRRPLSDETEDYDKPPSRKSQRRPPKDDYEDDSLQADDSRGYDRPRQNSDRTTKPRDDTRTIIKPISGSIYDRPRVAPKIKRPVPKSEADKFAYKPVEAQASSITEEEYYDDYEEVAPVRKNPRKPQSEIRFGNRGENSRKQSAFVPRLKRPDSSDLEEVSRPRSNRGKTKRPVTEKYYDDYEEEEEEKTEVQRLPAVRTNERRTKPSTSTSTTTTTTTTTTTEAPPEKFEQPVVRLVKRPFLPSRGGNPFAARGLQPVGSKAVGRKPERVLGEDNLKIHDGNEKNVDETIDVEPDTFKPSPPVSRLPINSDKFRPRATEQRKPYNQDPRTTQKPKVPERNPLDISEEDYDVTLNDALNPTLPNLPVRGSPGGFSPNSDYAFADFQQTRYNYNPVASAANSESVYQAKPARQSYQPQQEHFVQSNAEFKGLYSNYRPRQVQQQTEVFYSRF